MRKVALLLMVLGCQAAYAAGMDGLPDTRLTPGAINPNVTPQNIHDTICVRGYSKSIRPPASYTNKLKRKQIMQYGYWDRNRSHYEEDHLISLELGGSPADPKNLWPEPRRVQWGAKEKNELENVLHKAVCDDTIPLAQAQHEIAADWIGAYRKYIGE